MNVFWQGVASVAIIATITTALWLLWSWVKWLRLPTLIITHGTGAGKKYRIIKTEGTTLTVAEHWSVNSDTTTEFTIRK